MPKETHMTIKNQNAANLIAAQLAQGITHPGAENRQATNLNFPGLDPRGKPTHMQEAIKGALQAISEAIIHHLEQTHTIIPTEHLKTLQDELGKLKKEHETHATELIQDTYEIITGKPVDLSQDTP